MMKYILLLGLVACLGILAIPLALPVRADTRAFVPPTAAPAVAAPTVPAMAPVPEPERVSSPSQDKSQLGLYILGIMDGWPRALPEVETADYSDVALSITKVVSTPEDGVLLAGVGYFEGARYAAYVDDGRCNDPKWRRSKEAVIMHHGDCDHGRAMSLWQIWPVEDPFSPLHELCSKEAITASREGAARCALEKLHRSLKMNGNLTGYTGEIGDFHPKADERWNFVQQALKAHPFALAKPEASL